MTRKERKEARAERYRQYAENAEKRANTAFNISNDAVADTPREAYAALIDRISGKGTWESNPFVFAYEFERVK